MAEYIIDIECDSLTPTVVHCVVVKEVESGVVSVFRGRSAFISDIVSTGHHLYIGHNALSYDIPVLNRLWDTGISLNDVQDTLVLSKLYSPNRKGGHSLDAWGKRLRMPKGDVDTFAVYTPEMLEYCRQDVAITYALYKYLLREGKDFSDSSRILEHQSRIILDEQQANGFQLDTTLCYDLLHRLRERRKYIGTDMQSKYPPLAKFKRLVTPKLTKAKKLAKVGIKDFDEDTVTAGATISVLEWVPFNPSSRTQIAVRLEMMGWVPKNHTDKGAAMINEVILEELVAEFPDAALISEFMMTSKRVTQIESWLKFADEGGRVHGKVDTLGTRTTRMSHSSPNVSQVPSGRKPYGEVCRACWTVTDWETHSLLGVDASGLELRMLAHYMRDDAYTEEILHGDIHTYNMKLAGLTNRDQAKTFIYALLYGAGDEKLGSIVGGGAREGAKLRKRFMAGLPAYARLREAVEGAAKKYRRIKVIDGRYLSVDSPHTALNTLLQGSGAVVMKRALLDADTQIKYMKYDSRWVANSHDEMQAEVLIKDVAKVAKICITAIQMAATFYDMKCPLDAEFKVGKTWLETH